MGFDRSAGSEHVAAGKPAAAVPGLVCSAVAAAPAGAVPVAVAQGAAEPAQAGEQSTAAVTALEQCGQLGFAVS